jgi:hypothetical protein
MILTGAESQIDSAAEAAIAILQKLNDERTAAGSTKGGK